MKARLEILSLIISSLFLMAIANSVLAQDTSGAEVFELGEVIVSGDRETVDLATTVTRITEEDITAKGAQTVGEALEFLPGLDIQNGAKREAHVSIRGFEQNQVKILIDGVPAHESWAGTVDLSLLPTDAVSKIIVTKGASSVLYGSNTMGGVINIITKKGGKKPYTSFTTSIGNEGTENFILNHGASVGSFNYWITGGYRTSDGYRLSDDFNTEHAQFGIGSPYNEDGGTRDLSYYDKKNLNLKVGYDPDSETSVYLSFDYVDNTRGIPTFSNRYWAYAKWDQWQLNLVGEQKFTEILKAKARIYYVDHNDGLKDMSWDADHKTKGMKWFERSYYDDYSVGGEIHSFWNFGKWSNLKAGINYIEDNHKESDFLTDDCWEVIQGSATTGWRPEREYASKTYTVAIEDEIKPFDRFAITAGISYDTFKPTKTYDQPEPGKTDTINPQIGLVFDMTDTMSFHGSVGKKTRFPNLRELYSTMIGGNPTLDPEMTMAYELGVSRTFSPEIKASIAYFYNDVKDLIAYINDVFVNINKASICGVEANLDMILIENLSANLNYTYMETKDKSNNDRELEAKPRHRINLDLGYVFPFGLTANMQASYTQRQFWENNNNEWEKLPDFCLLNTKLTQKLGQFWKIKTEAFAQVTNITDKNYFETWGPEPGRNYLIGLTMHF